ncbi:hypothetical protein Lal_00035335 [Lupinus albus]|nr:hypothetical protein Lal_00035335 [Lupinus albus]
MTPFESRGLTEKMASNSQQFNARSNDAIIVRGVHDDGTDSVRQEKLERKIDSLTTLVTQLAMNQPKQPMARVCGICTSPDHYSDVCPSLFEPRTTDHPEAYDANIYNNRPNQKQQNYDPSNQQIQSWQQQVINNPPPAPSEPSLEELVRQMTMQNMQFQQETRAFIQRQESSIQNLTTQIGQMTTSLNTLQSHNSDNLPSQTVINPKNVSAITLRSEKQTELPTSDESLIMDDKSIQGLGGPMTRAKAKRAKLALERLVDRTLESSQGASTNARPIHFMVQEEDFGGNGLKAAT